VFGAGEYRPNSQKGRRLLAHELTHVVQQGASGPAGGQRTCGGAGRALLQRAEAEIDVQSGCPGNNETIHQGLLAARAGAAAIADPKAQTCILDKLESASIICRKGEDCGGAYKFGKTIYIHEWGMGCPSLPAGILHEAAHKCKWFSSEMFAEACENEAFGGKGATLDPAEQGGKCQL
jgi:hypothetical protein